MWATTHSIFSFVTINNVLQLDFGFLYPVMFEFSIWFIFPFKLTQFCNICFPLSVSLILFYFFGTLLQSFWVPCTIQSNQRKIDYSIITITLIQFVNCIILLCYFYFIDTSTRMHVLFSFTMTLSCPIPSLGMESIILPKIKLKRIDCIKNALKEMKTTLHIYHYWLIPYASYQKRYHIEFARGFAVTLTFCFLDFASIFIIILYN